MVIKKKGGKSWLELKWEMKNGVKHGYYKQFDESGRVISEKNYLNGEIS